MNVLEKELFGRKFKIVEPGTIPITSVHYVPGTFSDIEPALEMWCLGIKKDDVVVDVGACFGMYSLPALAAGAKVIAYEPWDDGRSIFEMNYEQNQFDNPLTIRPLALWDNTPLSEELRKEVWGFHYKNDDAVVVPTTLDDDLALLNVDRVDWIKIDVEGAELPVLLGAQKTLESRPTLIIEDHENITPNNVGRYPASINSSKRIHELLRSLGYSIEVIPWICNRKYIVARHPSR